MYYSQYCLIFASLPCLRQELNDFVIYWNSHLIRKNKLTQSPSGVPNEMYEVPSLYGMLFMRTCIGYVNYS